MNILQDFRHALTHVLMTLKLQLLISETLIVLMTLNDLKSLQLAAIQFVMCSKYFNTYDSLLLKS